MDVSVQVLFGKHYTKKASHHALLVGSVSWDPQLQHLPFDIIINVMLMDKLNPHLCCNMQAWMMEIYYTHCIMLLETQSPMSMAATTSHSIENYNSPNADTPRLT